MNRFFRSVLVWLYFGLSSLYPYRFRSVFRDEIREIFLDVVDEAEEAGGFGLLRTSVSELKGILFSIIRENWYALKSGKEMKMASENGSRSSSLLHDKGGPLVSVGPPSWHWIILWVTLMIVAILTGWLLMSPVTLLLLFITDLGSKVGILPGIDINSLEPVSLFVGFALTFAISQWLMLRRHLPRAKSWLLATGIGFLVAGIFVGMLVPILNWLNIDTEWRVAIFFLFIGACVGFSQWLVLRKVLDHAHWILLIDIIAASSILLMGNSITSLSEFLVLLMLPGLVTGIGLWLLLKQSKPESIGSYITKSRLGTKQLPKKVLWGFLGLGSLVPLFFLFSWFFAISQIELAKSRGIYATPEDAVIALNSQGWGGAQVVEIVGVHAGPNRRDGSQPHVWFGGGTVYLDRVPEGWNRTHYLAGSFYIHVKDGWVHVPEGAFPEYVGWVMELYDLENVNEWILENQ
jgi:hypothetical protein